MVNLLFITNFRFKASGSGCEVHSSGFRPRGSGDKSPISRDNDRAHNLIAFQRPRVQPPRKHPTVLTARRERGTLPHDDHPPLGHREGGGAVHGTDQDAEGEGRGGVVRAWFGVWGLELTVEGLGFRV